VNLAAVLKYDGSKTMAAMFMNACKAAAGDTALRRKRKRQSVLLVTILPDDDMAELLTYQAQHINQARAAAGLSELERATDQRDHELAAEPRQEHAATSPGSNALAAASRRLILRPLQQLRQLGDAGCDFSRFIFGHEIRRGTSARLRFEVDTRHGEIVGVAHDVGDAAILFDSPWRRKTALWHGATRSSKTFYASTALLRTLLCRTFSLCA
jgi:hypothetical protein